MPSRPAAVSQEVLLPGACAGGREWRGPNVGKALLTWEDVACLGSQLRRNRSTFLVKKRSRCYPGLAVDGRGSSVVPNAGAVLLLRTAEVVGLDAALWTALGPWRRPLARHDPGKVLLDLAVSLAIGGTAWPTWRSCAPRRRCSARWP